LVAAPALPLSHHRKARLPVERFALEGSSTYPIEPFEITRPAITDHAFETTFHA
jgi:hypothetical protein